MVEVVQHTAVVETVVGIAAVVVAAAESLDAVDIVVAAVAAENSVVAAAGSWAAPEAEDTWLVVALHFHSRWVDTALHFRE